MAAIGTLNREKKKHEKSIAALAWMPLWLDWPKTKTMSDRILAAGEMCSILDYYSPPPPATHPLERSGVYCFTIILKTSHFPCIPKLI